MYRYYSPGTSKLSLSLLRAISQSVLLVKSHCICTCRGCTCAHVAATLSAFECVLLEKCATWYSFIQICCKNAVLANFRGMFLILATPGERPQMPKNTYKCFANTYECFANTYKCLAIIGNWRRIAFLSLLATLFA